MPDSDMLSNRISVAARKAKRRNAIRPIFPCEITDYRYREICSDERVDKFEEMGYFEYATHPNSRSSPITKLNMKIVSNFLVALFAFSLGHAFAAHAEHAGHEFLGHGQFAGGQAVQRQQQPAA